MSNDLTPQQIAELKAVIAEQGRKIDELKAALKARYAAPVQVAPDNIEDWTSAILETRAQWEAVIAARAAGKSVKVTPFYAPNDRKIITF